MRRLINSSEDVGGCCRVTTSSKRPRRWRGDTLSCLCAQSRAANSDWKQASCPGEGPLLGYYKVSGEG